MHRLKYSSTNTITGSSDEMKSKTHIQKLKICIFKDSINSTSMYSKSLEQTFSRIIQGNFSQWFYLFAVPIIEKQHKNLLLCFINFCDQFHCSCFICSAITATLIAWLVSQ